MAKSIEWVKVVLGNWKVIWGIILMVASWAGYNEAVIAEKEVELEDTREQVTAVANHLTKTVIVEKPVIVTPCNCNELIQKHKDEFH